ncbi:coagulation factor IX [Xenopus laevis]|uniref:Coagulation factor IX n=2 Tax=Xenopus laevis TaxID=8355 RepID=A0A1L8F826_XENLA|nr:coagulation factor IX [Xenopus laevis]OCT67735.1 hypothetical protein XELAEV_18039038mg [Xenopus laevis]
MAAFSSILVIYLLVSFCSAQNTVFLSDKSASSILVRQKRYNTGRLEEFVADNLERECLEEKCNYEEAREVFENDGKTKEFWKQYIDGDQCLSNPCLNGGACKDDVSAYVCWCQQGYSGKNCELALPVICSIMNGGCDHLCRNDPVKKVVCSCASGYKLVENGKTCEASVPYACGKVSAPEALPKQETRSFLDSIEIPNVTSIDHHNITHPEKNKEDIVPVTVDPFVRVVGGTNSLKGEFPWQVHLVNKDNIGFCGGSIINEKWIVTAAHCFLEIGEFKVVAGEHKTDVSEGTEQYRKAKIILHPTYNATKSKYNNDIALLELETPLELNDYVRPVCIGNMDFTDKLLKRNAFSMVSGWGDLRYNGRSAIILQKLAVPFVNRAACKRSSRFSVYANMFCAGYADEAKDTCEGDSGGPHVTQHKDLWFLTGITSWGEKCAQKDKYGFYTKVSGFTDWIQTTTKIG